MSIFVIGDKNTVLGFRLIGVRGKTIESISEARDSLAEILEDKEINLVLITREWAGKMRGEIDRLKMASLRPIVMEIPGEKDEPPEKPLAEYARRVIGIRT